MLAMHEVSERVGEDKKVVPDHYEVKGAIHANGAFEMAKEGDVISAEIVSVGRGADGSIAYHFRIIRKDAPPKQVAAPQKAASEAPRLA